MASARWRDGLHRLPHRNPRRGGAGLPRRGNPYVCMDWRHLAELLAAGKQVYSEMKNLCVWNKTNGGMGTSTVPSTS